MGALALVATSFAFPIDSRIAIHLDADLAASHNERLLGLAFWTLVTLFASSLPIRLPHGVQLAVSTAPLMAAANLGGPAAAAWIALVGTTELRELRGRVPWYGTLTNHAGIVIPVVAAGLVMGWV